MTHQDIVNVQSISVRGAEVQTAADFSMPWGNVEAWCTNIMDQHDSLLQAIEWLSQFGLNDRHIAELPDERTATLRALILDKFPDASPDEVDTFITLGLTNLTVLTPGQ